MRKLCLLIVLLAPALCKSAEGMWTPEQLPEIAEPLKAAGLALSVEQFADLGGHPMGAIVSLGGCSAAFVSSEGLVATNHHCAHGAIQLNSTVDRNLLRDGFYADQRSDEPSAGPASRIFVTREIRDVTAEVLAKVTPRMSDRRRRDAVETARKALLASCEATPGQRCNVASFHGGLIYRLMVQLEIRDVRLVYAPPEAIGAFGGEVDNWSWPRHTGDFAFYRAYVGADGMPADYAASNQPYRPQRHLRISRKGVAASGFVMLAGFPGSTNRYRLADEIEAAIGWTYPQQIRRLSELLDLVARFAPEGSDAAVKYASTVNGWSNARKNAQGHLDGFARAGALGQKRREEADLEAWLAARGKEGKQALQSLAALREHLAKARETRERDLILTTLNSSGMYSTARTLYRLSVERTQPDERRESGYQLRDESRIEASLRQLDRRLDPLVDRQLMRHALLGHAALPAAKRIPELDAFVGAKTPADAAAAVDAVLDSLYSGGELAKLDARLRLFGASRKEIEASEDSFLQLAVRLAPALKRIEDADFAHRGGLLRLQPGYMQAMIDFRASRGLATYPDANGTLRLTFGSVDGVSPRDGIRYLPFTSTAGIVAKHTGIAPFDATDAQLKAIGEARWISRPEPGVNGLPVNFLADLDVTGGNSGSATLDAHGELVGLVFDMTWESVASNWVFDRALTRTIHVDARYMRWVMEHVYPAPAVLRELGMRGD